MSVAAIGGASASSSVGGTAFADLSSGEFVKIMLEELANQDPFEPQDSAALLEQLSSLRNIESQISLEEKLESLVLQNSLSASAGMIGKDVEGLDAFSDKVSGMVTSVRIEDGKAILELTSGKALAADNVTRIFDSDSVSAGAGG